MESGGDGTFWGVNCSGGEPESAGGGPAGSHGGPRAPERGERCRDGGTRALPGGLVLQPPPGPSQPCAPQEGPLFGGRLAAMPALSGDE